MKNKRWLCGVSTLIICLMFTGCGHEHTWTEATCTKPKTCSECGETEGEALGHTWVEATCAEPKTCSVCGETEGEALAHTWVEATCAEAKHCSVCGETEGEPLEHTLTEANYQQAATCEVCGQTVGEPLQAEFEKLRFECKAELDTEYPIKVFWHNTDINDIPLHIEAGKVIFSDYEIFEADDTHEALEDYEWRAVTITMILDEDNAITYNTVGIIPLPEFTDFYCNFDNTYNESTDTYTVNYNGTDYTDVKVDDEILQNNWNDNILTFQFRAFQRVPKGYDGIVITVVGDDLSDSDDDIPTTDKMDAESVCFRLR